MRHLVPGLLHKPQERGKVGGPLFQGRDNGRAEPGLIRRLALRAQPLAIVKKAALAVELWMGNHRKIVFQAYPIREPPHRPRRVPEVPELAGTVQGRGVIVNVVVNVLAVCVCGDEKGILALCPAHRRFIADAVCLLRGNLAGLKGLPDLIAEYVGIPFLFPTRDGFILGLAQKELRVGGLVVALVGRNELAALRLFRVLAVVETVFQRLGNRLPLADMVGF